jgi:hypothetical protein
MKIIVPIIMIFIYVPGFPYAVRRSIKENIPAIRFIKKTNDAWHYVKGKHEGHYLILSPHFDDTSGVSSDTGSGILSAIERGAVKFPTGNIRIYPNPTDGELTIEFDDAANDEIIQIVDLLGIKVFESPYHKTINISALDRGIYFLKLLDKNHGLIAMERVIRK